MYNNFVLVMYAERAVEEFGLPSELLEIPDGVFSELVDATGGVTSKFVKGSPCNGETGSIAHE